MHSLTDAAVAYILWQCLIQAMSACAHKNGQWCSFDNAEVYAGGKAEEVMGEAIEVRLWVKNKPISCLHSTCTAVSLYYRRHIVHQEMSISLGAWL